MSQEPLRDETAKMSLPPSLSAIVVDDQRGLAELLAERLAMDGIRATVATSAGEALRVCSSQHFDVAFVDLRLPDMSGIATAAELKKLSGATKVILMTGFATSLEDAEAGWPQVDGVLPKPWRPGELESLLRVVGRRES